jgi:hypothetical protein
MNYYVNFLGQLSSNGFHVDEGLAPMAIEKIKILGAVVMELQAGQHCEFRPFTIEMGQVR